MRRLFPLVAAVILVDTMFYAAITPLLPEYANEHGLTKTAAGVLSAAYAAGTLIAALPSGFLAARIGFRSTMLVGLFLLGTSSVVFAFATEIVVLDLARFAEGVGGACAWTGGLAWLLAAAPLERRGEMIGAALAAAIFGILLGPVIGGIATVTGPEVVFCAVGVIAGGARGAGPRHPGDQAERGAERASRSGGDHGRAGAVRVLARRPAVGPLGRLRRADPAADGQLRRLRDRGRRRLLHRGGDRGVHGAGDRPLSRIAEGGWPPSWPACLRRRSRR